MKCYRWDKPSAIIFLVVPWKARKEGHAFTGRVSCLAQAWKWDRLLGYRGRTEKVDH